MSTGRTRRPTTAFGASAPAKSDAHDLPDEAYAAALAGVRGIGPRSLRALLDNATPRTAWDALIDRTSPDPRHGRWADEAARIDVGALWQHYRRQSVDVRLLGRVGYPSVLGNDQEAPAVLFGAGDPLVLDRHPRVAIVGTRSATRYGLSIAARLGTELAGMGVVVVSGLALGIDGAAHEGALAGWRSAGGAPPVAVVAGDVASPYPRSHAALWRRVAEAGAVLSEAPLGSADIGWRFPQRNRIIAALADVVVVVECHLRGGSFHTVDAANRRGVPVGAVPGSVRSPASAGTNALLADGCFVVRDSADVMVAIGLANASSAPLRRRGRSDPGVPEPTVVAPLEQLPLPAAPLRPTGGEEASELEARVLDALGWERCSLDEVLRRTGLPLDAVSAALERLRVDGGVQGEAGCWERR